METNIDDVPNMILEDILVKFPRRSITILKVVCKRWKSLIESVIFRNLFISLHQNSSCSWSLLRSFHYNLKSRSEFIASYRCERWGLQRSFGSYITSPFMDSGTGITSYVTRATSSTGLLLIQTLYYIYYVGNPMSREWIKIPTHTLSPISYDNIGLATNVDENGVVLSYKKVVFEKTNLTLHVYSSETGEWTYENLSCRDDIPSSWSSKLSTEPISLNNILYWETPGYSGEDIGGIIAIDMYKTNVIGQYKSLAIPFPNKDLHFRENIYPLVSPVSTIREAPGEIFFFLFFNIA